MKNLFFKLVSLLTNMTPAAQGRYYVPAEANLESYNGSLYVLIKTQSGKLWLTIDKTPKDHLHRDLDYYKHALRRGKHPQTGGNIYSPLSGKLVSSEPFTTHLSCIEYHSLTFFRLTPAESFNKYRIFKYRTIGAPKSTRIALSLDYNSFITNYDKDPNYWNSISLEDLLRDPIKKSSTRISADDLF